MTDKRSRQTRPRLVVYLEPEVKDWLEADSAMSGVKPSTIVSQILTLAGRRGVSLAGVLGAVACAPAGTASAPPVHRRTPEPAPNSAVPASAPPVHRSSTASAPLNTATYPLVERVLLENSYSLKEGEPKDPNRFAEMAADLVKVYPKGWDRGTRRARTANATAVERELYEAEARGHSLGSILGAAKALAEAVGGTEAAQANPKLQNWVRASGYLDEIPEAVPEVEAVTLRDDALSDALRLLAVECENDQRLGFGASLAADGAKASTAAWFTSKRNAKLHEFADGAWKEWRPRGIPNVPGSSRPSAKQQRIKAAVDLVKARCPAKQEPRREKHQDPPASYASFIPSKGVPQ